MDHPSVKYGVIGGFASIIITLIIWFINPDYLFSYGAAIGFIVLIYSMYMAGKEARELSDGYIDFGEIFKYLFIAFVVVSLITTIFDYVLINFIDPSMIERQKEFSIKISEFIASMFGYEETLDELTESIEDQELSYTIGTAIQGWIFGMIFGAIIAAIQGAIMKKKDPNFNEFA